MGHNTMSDNQAGLVDFAMFRPGENVGTSEWVTVDQPMISGFGDITLDPDPNCQGLSIQMRILFGD